MTSGQPPLSLHFTAVALALFYFRFRLPFPVGGQRASDFYLLLELACLVAPNETPIAFLRLDDSSLSGFAFLLRCHFFLGFFVTSHRCTLPVVLFLAPRPLLPPRPPAHLFHILASHVPLVAVLELDEAFP
jgi:hypothetical protein